MTVSRPTKTAALAASALLVGAGIANGKSTERGWLDRDTFKCKPIGPENRLEPPPPLPLAKGEDMKQTSLIRQFEEVNKLPEPPCPEGDVAYPLPLTGTAQKVAPPGPTSPVRLKQASREQQPENLKTPPARGMKSTPKTTGGYLSTSGRTPREHRSRSISPIRKPTLLATQLRK